MGEFIHATIIDDRAVAAGTVVTEDLPVNPLSHMLLTLRFLQDQANTMLDFVNILAMVERVEVLFKGSAILSLSGLDLVAVGIFINGFESWETNADGDDDDRRSFTFLIPLTRKLYSPLEAFPRSNRGELQVQITYAPAFTQIDSVTETYETVELPNAAPSRYMKTTVLALTPNATGEVDINLPIGNDISDLVLFGTSTPQGNTAARTIEDVKILVDNSSKFYSNINFETLHNMAGMSRPMPVAHGNHVHRSDAAVYVQFQNTSANMNQEHILDNHLHLPFDVLGDGEYMLETLGKSDVVVRINAGATDALRVIPIEIVRS